MEGIETKGIPHKKLRPILEKVRAKVRNHPIIVDLFKENKLDPKEFDLIPMCFAKLDVSARTDHGVIYFNVDLAKDGFGKNDHYIVHEAVHWADQCTGTKPTKGSDSGDYLKNPEEVEAFQNQVEYIDETKGKDKAEKYVEKVLDHHDVHDEKERKSRHDALMALASNSPEEIFARLVEKIKKAKIVDVEVIPGRGSIGEKPPKPYTPKLSPGEYSGKGAPLTREQRTELLSKMYTKETSREKERKEIISQFIKKLPKEIKSSVKGLINSNIDVLLSGNNDALNNLIGVQGRVRPQEENSWKYKITMKFYYPKVGFAPIENKEREYSFVMEIPKRRGQNIEPKDDELDSIVGEEIKTKFENKFNEIPTEDQKPIQISVYIEGMGRAEFGFVRNRFLRLEFAKGFGIYNPRVRARTHKAIMPAGTIGEKFPDLRERMEKIQTQESRRQEIEMLDKESEIPEEPENEDLEGQLPEVV